MHRTPPRSLTEADRRMRQLEIAAKDGGPDELVAYLTHTKRTRTPFDLEIVIPRWEEILLRLWKQKDLSLLFGNHWPFEDDDSVNFLCQILQGVHQKVVRGVGWKKLWRFVRRWLVNTGHDNDSTERMANSALEEFITSLDTNGELHYGDGARTAVVYGLVFPDFDEARALSLNYGDLVQIGDNIDGGATYYVGTDGMIRYLSLHRTRAETANDWGDIQDDYAAAQQMAEYD